MRSGYYKKLLECVLTAKSVVAKLSKISGLLYFDFVIILGQLTSETDQSCNQVKALKKKKI